MLPTLSPKSALASTNSHAIFNDQIRVSFKTAVKEEGKKKLVIINNYSSRQNIPQIPIEFGLNRYSL